MEEYWFGVLLLQEVLCYLKYLRTIGGISLSFWLVCLLALKLNSVLQLKGGGSHPKVWEQVVVAISSGFGEFLQYEEGGDALCKG